MINPKAGEILGLKVYQKVRAIPQDVDLTVIAIPVPMFPNALRECVQKKGTKSAVISLGNKADLNETDFIEYFVDDPETDIILGYIEDVVEGRRFLEIARNATRVKPVIIVKSSGTAAGARTASSQTGALAGSENAFTAAFSQTGIIRAEVI